MATLLIMVIAAIGYILAYRIYGRWLSHKIFHLDATAVTPAHAHNDGHDYVPTRAEVLFGHHFTTIAGTGPIVGPAIAVIWGWLPALVWVMLGPIFMGAVHDMGSMVISARNKGVSIGEVAEEIINPRVRTLFLLIIFFALLIIIAIFGLVIAVIFAKYPESVIPVWSEIPIALWLAWMVHKRGASMRAMGAIAVFLMYVFVYVGYKVPVPPEILPTSINPVVLWTLLLLAYAYVASTLPVHRLLQPRDYINSHQLFIIMAILFLGMLVARPEIVAPAVQLHPEGAPPIVPMIFVIIACGAISGFHSLAGSGTTSKQLDKETDALTIGYGSMLLEGFLAVLVILACTAGFASHEAWTHHYASFAAASGLGAKLGAFVDGSAHIVSKAFGINLGLMTTVMGVFVASFAATTLDSATRIQRYVVEELAHDYRIPVLTNKHAATTVAVVTAAALAFAQEGGKGGLLLWPLFGATNQLLAGLAFLVIYVYLLRRGKPTMFMLIPMVFMIVMTAWAMLINLQTFIEGRQWHLIAISAIVMVLEIWMIFETIGVARNLAGESQMEGGA
ncbi:MAG: carbon starvation protein A [Deltaproteobacteria bacterium]|nr:carbon starvation protein A [Deltaproteobacteria bacterium]MCB9479211.1 carbon starvation protein A [Deltaproteobacteria bacterium]MCB9490051.1 carbon starvation protein A [Deltaproteobacteria bacterium]